MAQFIKTGECPICGLQAQMNEPTSFVFQFACRRCGRFEATFPALINLRTSVTAVQKGISLPALQRLLGHDHLATTEIYLNLSPEHVISEFNAKW